MNITKTISQFHIDDVYFCDPIKNNIMTEGNFIRILYSTPLFILNGIYLSFKFSNLLIEKYYNKFRCSFDINNHKELIHKIKYIEEMILKKVNIKNKIQTLKINEQIRTGNIKIFAENIDLINSNFMLKISGIWETDTHYGVTYKFFYL